MAQAVGRPRQRLPRQLVDSSSLEAFKVVALVSTTWWWAVSTQKG